MRPISHHMVPFTPDRMESIRANREVGLLRLTEAHKPKEKKSPSKKSGGTRKKRKIVLTEETKAMLQQLDPETRAIIEAQM